MHAELASIRQTHADLRTGQQKLKAILDDLAQEQKRMEDALTVYRVAILLIFALFCLLFPIFGNFFNFGILHQTFICCLTVKTTPVFRKKKPKSVLSFQHLRLGKL